MAVQMSRSREKVSQPHGSVTHIVVAHFQIHTPLPPAAMTIQLPQSSITPITMHHVHRLSCRSDYRLQQATEVTRKATQCNEERLLDQAVKHTTASRGGDTKGHPNRGMGRSSHRGICK